MKLFDVYPLFDVNIVKGKGCHVWDEKGQRKRKRLPRMGRQRSGIP